MPPTTISNPALESRRALTPTELEQFVVGLAHSRERWQHLVRTSEEDRVYKQIWDGPHVNAWIICWSEDNDTGFHDHHDSAAAITVISGEVREDRLLRHFPGPSIARTISAGESFSVPPRAIHRVLHSGSGPAITIHAYSPPLALMRAYRSGTGGELERELLSVNEELRAEAA